MKTILLRFKNEAQFYRLREDKQRREKKERRLITWEEYSQILVKLSKRRLNDGKNY